MAIFKARATFSKAQHFGAYSAVSFQGGGIHHESLGDEVGTWSTFSTKVLSHEHVPSSSFFSSMTGAVPFG